MELSENYGVVYGESAPMRPLFWVLCLLSLIPLAVVLPITPTRVGIAIVTGWIALIWVAISFARRQFDYFVLVWVAIYPYCYYFLSFPAERSIFTADRAFIALLTIEMLIASRQSLAATVRSRNRNLHS